MKRCPKCNFLMKILPHMRKLRCFLFGRDNKEVQGPNTNLYAKYALVLVLFQYRLYIYVLVDNRSNCHCFWNCGKIQDKKSQGTQAGGTMAMIGIVLGIIGVGAAVALLIYAALMTDPVVCRLPESLEIYLNEKGNN